MFRSFVAVSGQGISGKSSHCSSHGSSESGNASQDPPAMCGPVSPQTTQEQQQHWTGSSSHEQASKDLSTESLPKITGSGIKNTVTCDTQSHKVPAESDSCEVATEPAPLDLRGARSKYCEGDGNTCTALPQRAQDCVGSKTVLDKTLPQNTNDEAPSETSCSTVKSVGKETGTSAGREV